MPLRGPTLRICPRVGWLLLARAARPPAIRLQPFGLPLTYDRAPWYARNQTARHGLQTLRAVGPFISEFLIIRGPLAGRFTIAFVNMRADDFWRAEIDEQSARPSIPPALDFNTRG